MGAQTTKLPYLYICVRHAVGDGGPKISAPPRDHCDSTKGGI
jgi:hypothetical protein